MCFRLIIWLVFGSGWLSRWYWISLFVLICVVNSRCICLVLILWFLVCLVSICNCCFFCGLFCIVLFDWVLFWVI